MTQEERQQKFELFVEGMNMPLEVKLVPRSKTRIILNILGDFFLWLFDESSLNGLALIGIVIAIVLTIVYSFSQVAFFILLIVILCVLIYYIISLCRYAFLPLSKDRIMIKIDTNGITVDKSFYEWNEINAPNATNHGIANDKWTKTSQDIHAYLSFYTNSGRNENILITQHKFIPSVGGGVNYCLEKYRDFYHIKKNTFNL